MLREVIFALFARHLRRVPVEDEYTFWIDFFAQNGNGDLKVLWNQIANSPQAVALRGGTTL